MFAVLALKKAVLRPGVELGHKCGYTASVTDGSGNVNASVSGLVVVTSIKSDPPIHFSPWLESRKGQGFGILDLSYHRVLHPRGFRRCINRLGILAVRY